MQKNKIHRPVLLCRATLMAIVAVVAICVSLALHPAKADATANSTVNFQARLMTAGGAIVPDGNYNVEFKLYNALTSSGSSQGSCTGDANCLWTETRTSANQVRVANGYMTVSLGSVTSFPSTINWDQNLWLSMRIGGTGTAVWDPEMSPRLALTATPYSFSAGQLANTNGANRSTLTWVTQTASNSIQLPNEGGTLCIQGSSNCGFLTTGTGSYIQNTTTASIQTATIAIQSTSINTTTEVLKVLSGQNNDALDILDPAGNAIAGIESSGAIFSAPSGTAIPGNARLFVQPLSSSSTAIIARASSGATADIFDAQDSTGTNTLFSIGATGNVAAKTTTNSSSALQVQNSNGAVVLGVDTTSTTNLFSNPDFDVNTTGWTNTTNGALTRQTTSTNAYEGANSGQIVTTGTGGGMKSNGTAAFASGSAPTTGTYTLSFFAKLSSGTFTTLSAGYNQGASDVPCTLNSNTVLTTGFQRYSCTFTTTGTMSYVFVTQTDATGRTFYIDGLQLQSGSSATPYQIGGVQLRGIVTSPVVIQGSANSTSAFQIQNAAGTSNLFVADTLNSRIGIGTSAPTAPLDVVGQINTSVGLSIGGTSVCDTTGGTGCIAKSGSGFYIHNQTTIQTSASMFIQGSSGNVTAVLEANGADILDLKNSSAVNVATFSSTGAVLFKNSTDSTSGFQVQQNGSSTPVLNVDTSNARVGIGQATPTRLFDIAQNSTQVASPMELLEQNGTGDATIELKSASSGTSFYVGQDTSNSGAFTVNSSTAATPTGISFVQSATMANDGSVNTIAQAFSTNVASGNLLVASFTWTHAGTETYTCSDSRGNTFTNTVTTTSTNAGQVLGMCWTLSGSSGADTITVTLPGNRLFRRMVISEYHGVLSSSPLDGSAVSTNNATNTGTTDGETTGSITTTQAGDLIVSADEATAAGGATVSTLTAGTGFTSRGITTVGGDVDDFGHEDKIQATIGSTNATWSDATTGANYVAGMIAFKAAPVSITDTFNNPLFTLSQTGAAKFTNSTNSTSQFVIQNASSTQLFGVDSTNGYINIGNGTTGSTAPTLLVLNSKTTSGDPATGVEGAMYYNAVNKSFRCYFNAAWRGCAGGAVYSQTGLPSGDSIANTTTLTPFAESYTIPGNDCVSGRHYRLTAGGMYTSTTTGTNTVALTLKMGTTVLVASPATTVANSVTSASAVSWTFSADIQCYLGNPNATGNVNAQATTTIATSTSGNTVTTSLAPNSNANSNGYVTLNTTTSQALTLSATWNVASAQNIIQMRQFTLEAIGP